MLVIFLVFLFPVQTYLCLSFSPLPLKVFFRVPVTPPFFAFEVLSSSVIGVSFFLGAGWA